MLNYTTRQLLPNGNYYVVRRQYVYDTDQHKPKIIRSRSISYVKKDGTCREIRHQRSEDEIRSEVNNAISHGGCLYFSVQRRKLKTGITQVYEYFFLKSKKDDKKESYVGKRLIGYIPTISDEMVSYDEIKYSNKVIEDVIVNNKIPIVSKKSPFEI